MSPDPVLSTSTRQRVFDRAARAWQDGKPHSAWQVLADAGLASAWPEFQRVALVRARRRYQAVMRGVGH